VYAFLCTLMCAQARTCTLAPLLFQAACASAHRYAKFDIYGLAAGLASSWAALAASSPELLHNSLAYDVLLTCAGLMHWVSLPPVLVCCARPLCTGSATVGAICRWSLNGVSLMSQTCGARLLCPLSGHSTARASRRCSCG